MKLEKFEQENIEEIEMLKNLSFRQVEAPSFVIPSYGFVWNKALSFALAVPALVLVFGLFINFNNSQAPYSKDLSLIEESNTRLLDQINTLDNDSTL